MSSSKSSTLGITTPTNASTSPSPTVSVQSTDDTSSTDGFADFQRSGGYIYIILFITFFVAMVYFIKVSLAKRKERRRLEKEHDSEAPPGYYGHVFDIQIDDSDLTRENRTSSRTNSNSFTPSLPDTLSPSHTTVTAVCSIQPPERALTSVPSASQHPPAYEELIELPQLNRNPSSVSIVSDNNMTASSSSSTSSSSRSPRT